MGTKHRIGERGCQIIGYWQKLSLQGQNSAVDVKKPSKLKQRAPWTGLELDVDKTLISQEETVWSFDQQNEGRQKRQSLNELVGTPPAKKIKTIDFPRNNVTSCEGWMEEGFWNLFLDELQTNEVDPFPGWSYPWTDGLC